MVSQEKIGDVLRVRAAAEARGELSGEPRHRRGITAAEPGNTDWRRGLAVARIKIGDVLATQGKHDEALTSYRASNAVARRLAVHRARHCRW